MCHKDHRSYCLITIQDDREYSDSQEVINTWEWCKQLHTIKCVRYNSSHFYREKNELKHLFFFFHFFILSDQNDILAFPFSRHTEYQPINQRKWVNWVICVCFIRNIYESYFRMACVTLKGNQRKKNYFSTKRKS